MELKISLALHLIGMAMWLGSLLVVTRLFKLFTNAGYRNPELLNLMGRLLFGYAVPGLVLSLITGLYQMAYAGIAAYMSQGWFHGKLTFVLLLIGVTVLCLGSLSKARAGAQLSRGLIGAMHGVVGLTLIVVVFITVFSGMYFSALGYKS
ncbi:MAG: hypothetical protein EBZ48_03645 [Proteobacteria bacterium]|nr:hypothetical protein [Pseudomonadota bacterium]